MRIIRRRPFLTVAIAVLFIVMPFVYDPAPVAVSPTPTTGATCDYRYVQGLGFDNWRIEWDCD